MPGFRYSAASAGGRQAGLDLLELTRRYEGLVVEAGLGVTNLAVLGLVARARHLLKRAYELAEAPPATTSEHRPVPKAQFAWPVYEFDAARTHADHCTSGRRSGTYPIDAAVGQPDVVTNLAEWPPSTETGARTGARPAPRTFKRLT